MAVYTNPALRHDFVLLFDVRDGNPNGDPDAGNLPRLDPETMQGLVTDVCLKRKVRDWVWLTCGGEKGYDIFVKHHGILNEELAKAYVELGQDSTGVGPRPNRSQRPIMEEARKQMCERCYDVRMFGAVMTTGPNAGQVRGPVQLTFARSVDPITPLDLSITRVAVTEPEKADQGAFTEMGRKAIVPYGLYRSHGFFSPAFAENTGVSEKDLDLFWKALVNMWDQDRSASRGEMTCRGLYIFTHDNKTGRAPAHALFGLITVQRRPGVEVARRFEDYEVRVNDQGLPQGVTLTRLVG